MALAPFADIPRVDAGPKVRGEAIYGADLRPANLTHGAFALATIARGTITAIDTAAAEAVPGVLLVVTHETIDPLVAGGFNMGGGYGFQSVQPLTTPQISYRGQPIAMVVADTLEAAEHAASLVEATYDAEPFAASIDSELARPVPQAEAATGYPVPDIVVGDAPGALAAAAAQIDATYRMATQHQNPMELLHTVAVWEGDRLTLHEGTQNSGAIKFGVAQALGIDPANVDVVSPQVGGGFGQKGGLQSHTALVAWAAREVGRPLKVVLPRDQVFHDSSYRAATVQRVRLGADAEGRMVAALYDIDAQTSMHDFFQSEHAATAARFYGFETFQSFARLVPTQMSTPGYMRTPFEHTVGFAMESAVDELAYAAGIDPVALRVRNDTQTDLTTSLPLSSRRVVQCLERGAETFGWADRSPEPGSMVAENGDLIGQGVAIGVYQSPHAANIARLRATAQGEIILSAGVHEMGQGIRTALAAVVARKLGVPPEQVQAVIGDTRGVPQHLTAGAWGTATGVSAAETACDALLTRLADLEADAPEGATPAEILQAAGREDIEVEVESLAAGQGRDALEALGYGGIAVAGPEYPTFVTMSYIAHFVEVRVEPGTRRIRVPRVVSVVDCGRVMSPRTARSQVIGGVVWGISGSLREGGEVDPRYGGVLNADIADYVIAVNADIGSIEVEFLDEPDAVTNEAGVKSLGEVVLVGVAAAIANAVFHATGQRVRDLPIRLDELV